MRTLSRQLIETPEYSLSGLGGADLYKPIRFVNTYTWKGPGSSVPATIAQADPMPGTSASMITASKTWPNGVQEFNLYRHPGYPDMSYNWGSEEHQAKVMAELAKVIQAKIEKSNTDVVKAKRTPTLVFAQSVLKALPLVSHLKYVVARTKIPGSSDRAGGAVAELVAGLTAEKQPDEALYRIVSNGLRPDVPDAATAIYFLATPAEFEELTGQLEKYSRQRAKKVVSESVTELVSRMLAPG